MNKERNTVLLKLVQWYVHWRLTPAFSTHKQASNLMVLMNYKRRQCCITDTSLLRNNTKGIFIKLLHELTLNLTDVCLFYNPTCTQQTSQELIKIVIPANHCSPINKEKCTALPEKTCAGTCTTHHCTQAQPSCELWLGFSYQDFCFIYLLSTFVITKW